MKNRKILQELLLPAYKKDMKKWHKFLDTVNNNIVWYPSSELDFYDLIYFNSNQIINKPLVYIHTDIGYFNQIARNKYFKHIGTNIQVNDRIILKINSDFNPVDDNIRANPVLSILLSANPENEAIKSEKERYKNLRQEKNILKVLKPKSNSEILAILKDNNPEKYKRVYSKAFLLNIDITINDRTIKNNNVLYIIIENISFLEYFICQKQLRVYHIVSIRNQMYQESLVNFWRIMSHVPNIKHLIVDDRIFDNFRKMKIENGFRIFYENNLFITLQPVTNIPFMWNNDSKVNIYRII